MVIHINKPKVIKCALVAAVVILVLFFSARFFALKYSIGYVQSKLLSKYHLTLDIEKSNYSGIKTVCLYNVYLHSGTDTLMFVDTFKINPRLFPLFVGNIRFKDIDIHNSKVNLNAALLDSTLFIKKQRNTADTVLKVADYSKLANSALKKLFSYIPSYVNAQMLDLTYTRQIHQVRMKVENVSLKNGVYKGYFEVWDSTNNNSGVFAGNIDKWNKSISFNVHSPNNSTITLPYITQKWGAWIGFDSLDVSFTYQDYSDNVLTLAGHGYVKNLTIKHKMVSPEEVKTKLGMLDFTIKTGDRFVEVDSSSVVTMNTFSFSPYFKYQHYKGHEVFIKVPRFEFDADTMFSSLPEGLFTSIRDMKVQGKLAYSLNCHIDFSKLDSLTFCSSLERLNYKILRYGDADLSKLNRSFLYEAYDHDQLAASFMVDSFSSNYVTLNNISPYLRYAVLTSEDGSFFYHRGFNEEAFTNSIAIDIKEKRFARGGSTITMQLVKNVFLNRNKTVSRKLEEVFITWMIENMHLVSKERMYEVYLNIIEWGPGVYGIKQASAYYFKKQPSQLSLNEAIYLTSIIPRPKYFKYTFDKSGKLLDYYSAYYKQLADIMLRRSQILPTDTIGLVPEIKLTGSAKDYMLKPDSIVAIDSTEFEIPEIGLPF
jgi:hypothetical protein